jgi:uncharacterized protein YraI
MSRLTWIGALAVFTAMGVAAAKAAPGFSTANVNFRTGPDTDFPAVDVIPEGEPVDIRGCLDDESWCDVIWAGQRGWVYSEYLAFEQRGRYVALPDVGLAAFSIPVVRFAAADYWDRYYVGRPWYKERTRWIGHKVRPRPGWHRPPSGKREAGWWRKDYRQPTGMKAPPMRDWKRPDRGRGPGGGNDRGRGPDRNDHRGGPGGDHRGDGRR